MGIRKIIVENWITRKLPESGNKTTLFLVCLLLTSSALFLNDVFNLSALMPASYDSVVLKHEYWRLWTALFAHGDLAHILGNLFLFVPFAYLLSHYFSLWLFPLIGFLIGGLINLIVVHYLGGDISIIGVSGVVYWMGATWMTLSFFIDRRSSKLHRFIKLSGVSLVLFFPTSFLPEVSYLSHFLGYVFGLMTGAIVYLIFRKRFLSAEVTREIDDVRDYFDWENFNVDQMRFELLQEKEIPTLNKWLERSHIKRNFVSRSSANIFIVFAGEVPLGFLQTNEEMDGSQRVEPFIAEKRLLGRGLGTIMLQKFTDDFFKAQANTFMVELSSSNGAAIRAFKKAGFIRNSKLFSSSGPIVLMTKTPNGHFRSS